MYIRADVPYLCNNTHMRTKTRTVGPKYFGFPFAGKLPDSRTYI